MLLHHLTTGLDAIMASGELRTTWPCPPYPDGEPTLLLWLTTDPDPDHFGMKIGTRMTGRVTVEVPEVQVCHWEVYRLGVRPETTSGLETSALRYGGDPSCWYVATSPILASQWVEAVKI